VFGVKYPLAAADTPAAMYFATRRVDGAGVETVTTTTERVRVLLGGGADTFLIDSANAVTAVTVDGGTGDDSVSVGTTVSGLHPDALRRVDFVAGAVTIAGGGGTDTVVLDDSGDAVANVGQLLGSTVTGLGITGSVTVAAGTSLQVFLGAGDDLFHVAATATGVGVVIDSGAGADTVRVGSIRPGPNAAVAGTLAGILGNVLVVSPSPDSGDTLYLDDQATTTGTAIVVTNADTGTRTLTTGGTWPVDTLTVSRSGAAASAAAASPRSCSAPAAPPT
jgi:hypothetical protein